MRKILCMMLALLAVCALAGCSNESNSESTKMPSAPMAVGKEEAEVFVIKTEYCELKYPDRWKEKATITTVDNVVTFSCSESNTPIFDIVFGGENGYLLGMLTVGSEAVAVRVVTYDFPKNLPNIEELVAMQDDVNVIINCLHTDYEFELST